ncbi:MAG TPA: GDP-mannose 4,6-dehydratase [Candidatus Eisenbacteria bacterium]|nr:GDP-mannose 4,6-dehydratase [Candidatus Eisenbacteria bacterium]
MKKVLITGASGFVGTHLAQHLLEVGDVRVHGTYLTDESMQRSPVKDLIAFHKVDLQDRNATEKLLREVMPDEVYHLAANALVTVSFANPLETFHNNVDPQVNLFESLRACNLLTTKVLLTCSSEEYGFIAPEDLPMTETTALRPANPYAVSKVAQDFLGLQYFISYKMPIIRVRSFTHVGPGQSPGFVVADFSKQIAEIEKGGRDTVIKVGNMQTRRDFTDVRDMVRLYHLLLEKGEAGEVYNAGSGKSHVIQEVMDILIGLSSVKITLEEDPSKFRPADVPEILADITKAQAITGWKPEISFEQTLKDALDYWRGIV